MNCQEQIKLIKQIMCDADIIINKAYSEHNMKDLQEAVECKAMLKEELFYITHCLED